MVWSDQSVYPFEIYNLQGDLVMRVDDDGITLYDVTTGNRLAVIGDGAPPADPGIYAFDYAVKMLGMAMRGGGLISFPLDGTPLGAAGYVDFTNSGVGNPSVRPSVTVASMQMTDAAHKAGAIRMEGESADSTGVARNRYLTTGGPLNSVDSQITHEFMGFQYSLRQVAGVLVVEGWNTLPLLNAWVAVPGLVPQYRLNPDGTVQLRGCMGGGVTAPATQIGLLPLTYRPAQTYRFITAEQGTGTEFRHIAVQPSGVLNVFNCLTANICLDGIRFSLI